MAPPRPPLVLLVAAFLACCGLPAQARKVHATVYYTFKGKLIPLSSSGSQGTLDVGGQLVLDATLLEGQKPVGRLSSTCRAVAALGGGAFRVLCTKHYEWDGGATVMVAHSTEVYKAGAPMTAKVSVVGGIGRWQGAHGEDLDYQYDPRSETGGGKIVLYCLDGVC